MSDDDRARAAAAELVAGWIEPDTTIGLGSGRGVRAVIAALADRWPGGAPLRAAVASRSSGEAARAAGIDVVALDDGLDLAVVVDGADEVDPALQLLKGGGGALLHEKVLADAGGGLVVVAEAVKHVPRLGTSHLLPIEVVRYGWDITARRVADILAPPVLRAGAGDEPFVTEEGHLLLDTPLGEVGDLHALAATLSAVPGVVEHGLFLDMARAVVLGRADGTTELLGAAPMTVVGLLHPGAMGAALGGELRAAGHDVVWASEGRSERTRARARDAGLRDVGSVTALADAGEVVLSVCPPHAARDVAAAVAGRVEVFVDANAVAPATAREVAATIAGAGGHALDGGLVGPPPGPDASVSLLLSGDGAGGVARLFDGTRVRARVVGRDIGAASAAKMAYAGWTKGSAALLLAMRALARAEGVEDALLAEWAVSQPHLEEASARAARGAAGKSWRWVGEMHEIAASLEGAGLPAGFHEAAAAIFARLAEEPATDLSSVLNALACGTLPHGTRLK